MKKIIILVLCVLSLESSAGSFNESYDDMLIQCNVYERSVSKVRDKHPCEPDNNNDDDNDDFLYYITRLRTPHSGAEFLCVYFRKKMEGVRLRFRAWFSHENFSINAFGIKSATADGKKFESSVKFQVAAFVVVPRTNEDVPQVFGFELNGRNECSFCGVRVEDRAAGLIKAGTKINVNHKYPWHATIHHKEMASLQYKCGASIIRENKLLTAAHCVARNDQPLSVDKLVVRVEEGELLTSSRYQFGVFKSTIHERYRHETYENDIALLALETSLDILHGANVRAVCLPARGQSFSGMGFVVGFGTTEHSMSASSSLLETELPMVKKEDCIDSDPNYFTRHLFATNFCAGKRGTGVCSGDSGGGFFVQQNGLWVVKGIVSNTKQSADSSVKNPTCSDQNYALFTDVENYLDWIDRQIRDIDRN